MTPRRRAVSRVSRLARGVPHNATRGQGSGSHPSAGHPAVGALPGAPVPDPTPSRRTVHHETPGTRVTRQVESAHPAAILPDGVADDLVNGRLSQRCEPCGITEAAGGSCTSCGRLTGPADWFRGTSRKTQGDASRARVHSTAETGATALEAANPEPLRLWEALRYQF